MHIKYKKVLSYLLITLMLFSGMLYETILEDSIFDYTTVTHSSPYIGTYGNVITDATVCTTEMLGVRTTSYVQQFAARSQQRIAVKAAFDYLPVDHISQIFSKFFLTVHIVQFRDFCRQAVLVDYIHNKDGKK